MEGVGQKRFSGVWERFAKGLYDWTLGYENVGETCVGDTDTPKSAFDLEYELEKILQEPVGDSDWFFKAISTALSRVFHILPRILMSDKRDMRYEQVVREYCAEHLDVFLETWQVVQRRGRPLPDIKDIILGVQPMTNPVGNLFKVVYKK